MMQNVTRKVTLYEKHTGRAVEGFSYWNEAEMKNCSLYKPSPLGNTEIRTKTEESEEIKDIIILDWNSRRRVIGSCKRRYRFREKDFIYQKILSEIGKERLYYRAKNGKKVIVILICWISYVKS